MLLKEIWNNHSNSILTLTIVQYFQFISGKNLVVYQFNREFYCIKDHDQEVSCAGLLFFGNVHIPIIELDNKEHRKFQENSVKAITENPKLKSGMLKEIRSEFPLKAVSDGEETMAIGPNSLDKKTMKQIFGTDDYDKLKENLVAESGPDGPFIGYKVEASGEVFKVANIVIREDGRGYGGQFKFEMKLDKKEFAKRLEKAQSEIYG